MRRVVVGVGLAVVAHLAILLLGGLLFFKPPEEEKRVAQVDLLADEPAADEKRDEPAEPETAEATDTPMETERPPDVQEIVRLEEAAAAAAVPQLEALSLGALEDALNRTAAGGADDFVTGGSLASGGRIGGTGTAVASAALAESVFTLADLDQRPRPIFQAAPNYPYELRQRRTEGAVYVLFVVDEQGRVLEPKVEKSTHHAFEKPALDAVRQWKFEPAVREGKKVSCRMRAPIRFSAAG